MPGALQRLGRDWRFQIALTVYWAVFALWMARSSFESSAFYWSTSVWVATDNIAYFAWGALAGFLLIMVPLYALGALLIRKPLPTQQPLGLAFRLRDRPVTVFLAGLAIGASVGGVGIVAALVVAGAKVGWLVVWSIGFGAAISCWTPLVYLGFLFRAHARDQGSPA